MGQATIADHSYPDVRGFHRTNTIHPKAMPVILTTAEACDAWMGAPTVEALTLQRPLPDGALRIVAHGEKLDGWTERRLLI